MDSLSIVILGIFLVSGGGAILLYNRSLPRHALEHVLNGLGGVLVVCGLAVIRDGKTGSRHILWMLHDQAHHATHHGASQLNLPTQVGRETARS